MRLIRRSVRLRLALAVGALVALQFAPRPSAQGQVIITRQYNVGPGAGIPWAGIIDSGNAIDWRGAVGVVGGVPARTTICATIAASACGAGDCAPVIQNALNACASEQTVLLGAGQFLVNSDVSIPSNVTLRGAGPNSTILNCNGTTYGCGMLGSGGSHPTFTNATNITQGATAGSTSIVVASASNISVGSDLLINETNDTSYVTMQGGEGPCNWCDDAQTASGSADTSFRDRRQIVEVTSMSGAGNTTIGFAPALYSAYVNSPQAVPYTPTKRAGIENLQVYANNTGYNGLNGYAAMVTMTMCSNCWQIKTVVNYADGDWVHLHWCYRCEVRDNYFTNAYLHAAGSNDSDVFIASGTTASLIQNNIIERGHVGIMFDSGPAGNVVAYNYTEGEFDSTNAPINNFVIGCISMHGTHPQFNLLEGNVCDQLYPD
ncbi:MAG TPA: glycosyl hydrolase family 28-related protein, partial [Vicinamibacterales bacterium]|nr:glycosyl hydrolase family 28-related protein [Vicinamibacterales bacterium]